MKFHQPSWQRRWTDRACWPALGLLLTVSACQELWSPALQDNPANCARNPASCAADEVCDSLLEVCLPRHHLDDIAPRRGPSSGGLAIKLTGRGFAAGDAVLFDTAAATAVEPRSDSELGALSPARPGSCGPVTVTVKRPSGLAVTREALFSYFLSDLRFGPAQAAASTVGGFSVYISAGDLNSDGKVDLVSTDYGDGAIDILLSRPEPGFLPAVRIPIAAGSYHTAIADLDRDGRPDLIVASDAGGLVSVLFNDGGGQFRSPVKLTNSRAHSVQVLDLNQDGLLDLAVFTSEYKLRLWKNNGSGDFSLLSEEPAGAGSGYSGQGDLNHDGRSDLIVPSGTTGSPTLTVLLNRGDGTLQPLTPVAVAAGVTSIASADFNQDGLLDLAVTEYAAASVGILLGQGDGTFAPRRGLSSGPGSRIVVTGDVNCDGLLDLAVSHLGTPQVAVFLGHGDGTFETIGLSVMATGARSALAVAIVDLERDQKPELIFGVDGGAPSIRIAANLSQ